MATRDIVGTSAIILLVEDNAADILLFEEALMDISMNLNLNVVNNGEEAMAYLHRIPPFENAASPDLILLDLNLPKKNGFSVLEEVKQDTELLQIPIVVLSTSQSDEDIARSYRLRANCFVSKPSDLDRFVGVIRSITSFWLDTVRLPKYK